MKKKIKGHEKENSHKDKELKDDCHGMLEWKMLSSQSNNAN